MSELPKAEYELHHHTANSKAMEVLKERPVAANKISMPKGGPMRDLIRKINQPVTTTSGSKKYGFGKWQMVYYLYGDERRAIRVAIEKNEEYIAKAFKSETCPFKRGWGEGMFKILNEEWSIYRRKNE